MESFLGNLNHFLKLMPDYRPKNLEASIRPKCRVLYFPLNFPDGPVTTIRSAPCSVSKENIVSIPIRGKAALTSNLTHPRGVCDIKNILPEVHKIGLNADRLPYNTQVLHILWPHRWEHDKDPDTFFNVLFELHKENIPFKLSVLGETYQEVPEIFRAAENKLKDQILHYGFLSSKEEYWKVLHSADVVVSTAKHEFFGVAMLEAVYCKCYPLCPKQLVYPEIFPDEYLYSTPNQLFKRLKKFCLHPLVARNHLIKVDLKRYLWSSLKEDYLQVLFGPTEENISMKQIL